MQIGLRSINDYLSPKKSGIAQACKCNSTFSWVKDNIAQYNSIHVYYYMTNSPTAYQNAPYIRVCAIRVKCQQTAMNFVLVKHGQAGPVAPATVYPHPYLVQVVWSARTRSRTPRLLFTEAPHTGLAMINVQQDCNETPAGPCQLGTQIHQSILAPDHKKVSSPSQLRCLNLRDPNGGYSMCVRGQANRSMSDEKHSTLR